MKKPTHDELTLAQIADIIEMPEAQYYQRVIARFRSGRATQEEWLAMAAAVRYMSDSSEGAVVACIERGALGLPPEEAR